MNRPTFKPFDENSAVRIYQRSLPHWRQEGATYFVTFRLGDSIPGDVTRQWNEERRRWLAAHIADFDPRADDLHLAIGRLSVGDQFQYQKHFNRKLHECLDRGIGECHLSQAS